MRKRGKIKLISFCGAALLSLTVFGSVQSVRARRYETQAHAAEQRALLALSEYTDSIETSLTKSIYTGSDEMLSKLTLLLSRDCSGAKESLSVLSPGGSRVGNTYKFLSQVGAYTASLQKKAARGEKITPEEREILKKLRGYASGLSARFAYMSKLLADGYLSFEELDEAARAAGSDESSDSTVSFSDSVNKAEEAFGDFPTLLYDGPFSDNIFTKKSRLLEDAEPVSAAEAKKLAAKITGTEEKFLVEEKSGAGKTECYNFRTDSVFISITKRGGFPLLMISSPTVGEERLTGADAVHAAALFLYSLGFKDMTASYYASADGICTVNFAYKQDSFICYPDLIKISVTLDTGQISGFDAADFIMNHTKRDIPAFSLSPERAAAEAAEGLEVKRVSAAVIPTASGGEKFTYELFCISESGQHVLVYKNIENGTEEDILLLMYADNGTLTK